MKLLNLLFLSVVAGASIQSGIEVTEDAELVRSVEEAIKQYMEENNGRSGRNDTLPIKAPKGPQAAPFSKIGTESDARGFIKYAGAAYCSKEKLMNWSCVNCNGFASGAGEVTYFSDSGSKTAGYLAINKGQKSIIISFRGSQNIANWIGNINILFTNANLPSPFQNADIHSGFNKMTNALLPSVESALKSAISKYPSYKIIFTGHSLGGAIATLTAYRLAQKNVIGWDRVNLITYGQPRVGDPEFASFLNTKPMYSTRVTSYADLVAISPGKFLGYGHNQYNMHINKKGQTVKCSIYQEDDNCTSDHLIPSIDAHFTFWDQRMNSSC